MNSNLLQGFVNGGKLSPVEFREQLRQSFHLYLSRGEVAALIHLFDDNGDGSIDCDEFIRSFYRIGYEEREKYYYKHLQRTRKLQQQEILRKKKRDEYYMQKNIISLPEDPAALLTEENRTTVFNKIKEIAVNYERRQHWGNLLMPFDSTSLSPTRFREVLKQQFLLHLTTSDLVVLLDEFGIDAVNGEREINCKEFLSYFFHAGREEKEKILRKKIMSDEKLSKVKLNFEKNLSRELLNRKITAIEWPVLPQISSDNVNSDDGKSVMSGSQSLSTLSIDDEKNDNMSLYSLHENDSDSISTHLSPLQPLNTFTSPSRRSSNRMYRKPSVLDTISPNRLALKLIKSEGSIAAAYPNASDETKVNTSFQLISSVLEIPGRN